MDALDGYIELIFKEFKFLSYLIMVMGAFLLIFLTIMFSLIYDKIKKISDKVKKILTILELRNKNE